MIPDKLLEVLSHEGVVAIVTHGKKGIHVVNTWNTYLRVSEDGRLLAPVGGMKTAEEAINDNDKVVITLGSREVQGFRSKGTGFLIKGSALFVYDGQEFDKLKLDFPWARAVLVITPDSITQTL